MLRQIIQTAIGTALGIGLAALCFNLYLKYYPGEVSQAAGRSSDFFERQLDAVKSKVMPDKQSQEEPTQAKAAAPSNRKSTEELAWEKYYQPSERCRGDVSNQLVVECANEHAKARKKFEKDYAAKMKKERKEAAPRQE